MKYINLLYQWTLEKASHANAKWFLAFISFVESSVFPIPPDVVLIPMILANRTKAWFYAFICTLGSVLGGVCGYIIGAILFDSLGKFILENYNLLESFSNFKNYYNKYDYWIILGAGFTPFPYKLITITSGFINLNIYYFIILSFVARGSRFFLLAGLLWYFGQPIKKFIEKHLGKLSIAFFLLLVTSYILIKLL